MPRVHCASGQFSFVRAGALLGSSVVKLCFFLRVVPFGIDTSFETSMCIFLGEKMYGLLQCDMDAIQGMKCKCTASGKNMLSNSIIP